MSFTVLYLSEGRGFSTRDAALVFAAAQVLGGALRILLGHVSDRFGSRIVPLCRAALAVSGRWHSSPPSPARRTGSSSPCSRWPAGSACRGTAVVRRRGRDRRRPGEWRRDRAPADAARSRRIVAPIGFATLVAAGSWRIAFLVAALFPLAGWAVIHPLAAAEQASRSRSAGLVDALRTRSRGRATRRAARRRSARPTSCRRPRAPPTARRSPRR